MTRYLTRDRIAILAALAAPLAAAAILLPFRAGWSNTNVALLREPPAPDPRLEEMA
jgi:hypothetical protein